MHTYKYYYKHLFILAIVEVFLFKAHAQTDTIKNEQGISKFRDMFSVGAGIQHGFIFVHSPAVKYTKGSNPTGIEFVLSRQRNDAQVWDLCNCFPREGLVFNYYDYDNTILGRSYTAAYFLEPAYKLSKNAFFLSKDRRVFLTSIILLIRSEIQQTAPMALGSTLI